MSGSVDQLVEGVRAAWRAAPPSARTPHELDRLIDRVVGRSEPLLAPDAAVKLRRQVRAEVAGLGPLDPWLEHPDTTEVMVNAEREVWVDRGGVTERVATLAPGQLGGIIERIVGPLGLRLDRTSPIVDARLPDGSRLCAVVPPVSPDGPCCSIRTFRARPLGLRAFAAPAVVALIRELVVARANVIVSGATSSGKTTLLNALTGAVDAGERLVTIEDTAELRLAAPHVVRLEARVVLGEGGRGVDVRELVRTALRLRPDRLVVGEVRGPEALDMVLALNTGHDGSLTTCHANGALDALRRIEAMVLMGAPTWTPALAREQVHGSLDVVVHVGRDRDGSRRIREVAEIATPEELESGGDRIRRLAVDDDVVARLRRRRS